LALLLSPLSVSVLDSATTTSSFLLDRLLTQLYQPVIPLSVVNTMPLLGFQLSATDTTNSIAHFNHGLPVSLDYVCANYSSAAAAMNYSSAAITYCNRILGSCGYSSDSVYGQFNTLGQCLIEATWFPRGAVNDQTGNTLDCRLYHAGVAGQAVTHDAHCPHSGVNGKNLCGTNTCQSYCLAIQNACTGTNMQFSTTASCLAWCASFPDAYPDSTQLFLTQTGNSLQCHLYHASVAGYVDTAIHCPHAGPSGTTPTGAAVCGSACTNFCQGQLLACGTNGTNSQYASQAACESACASFSVGTIGLSTVSGNTLGCRIYHAGVALAGTASDKTTHCPHTGVTPTAACVGSSGSSTGSTDMGAASGLKASLSLVAALVVAAVVAL